MNEYEFEAAARCRECGRTIIVGAVRDDDGSILVLTTGRAPGCEHPKCGDKFPTHVYAAWPRQAAAETCAFCAHNSNEPCGAQHPDRPLLCTRESGHEGDHVACGESHSFAQWGER